MDGLALCQHVKEDVAETDVRCKCDPHNPTACPQLRHEAKRPSNTQVADRCIHRRVCLPQGLFGRAMHDPLITYCLLPLGQLYSPRDQHPVPAIIDLLLPRCAPTHPRCNQVNPGFPNKRQVHEYLVNSHLDYDIPNSDVGNSPVGVIFNPLGHFLVEIRGSQTNDETGWENKRQVSVGKIPLIRRRKLATRIFYHILRLLSTFPSVSMQLKLRVAHTLLATSHIERCVHCRDPMCASPHCTVQCILRIITLHFTRET